jgi:hypothetical protein
MIVEQLKQRESSFGVQYDFYTARLRTDNDYTIIHDRGMRVLIELPFLDDSREIFRVNRLWH